MAGPTRAVQHTLYRARPLGPVLSPVDAGEASGWGAASAATQLTTVHLSLAGQLAAGTCEIVTLDRDSSQPRRTIARQTARCACRKGQIAGTTRARPACVDGKSSGRRCQAQEGRRCWRGS